MNRQFNMRISVNLRDSDRKPRERHMKAAAAFQPQPPSSYEKNSPRLYMFGNVNGSTQHRDPSILGKGFLIQTLFDDSVDSVRTYLSLNPHSYPTNLQAAVGLSWLIYSVGRVHDADAITCFNSSRVTSANILLLVTSLYIWSKL